MKKKKKKQSGMKKLCQATTIFDEKKLPVMRDPKSLNEMRFTKTKKKMKTAESKPVARESLYKDRMILCIHRAMANFQESSKNQPLFTSKRHYPLPLTLDATIMSHKLKKKKKK